jgi:ribosomal protein S6-L-glutamate ligase RimK-like protein
MILFWGLPGDTPISAVADVLNRRRVKTLFLNQHESLQWSVDLSVGDSISGYLRRDGQVLDLAEVKAAYLRPYDARQLPGLANDARALAHASSLSEALLAWADITPAKVVNRPWAMAPNNSKPYQSVQIRSLGFAVPDTLITTDPDAARQFWEKHGTVIYKSVSSVRSIVSRLSSEHAERIKNVRWCPTQFQQYIGGTDYRVHVVGDEVFPCEIASHADDYRYACRTGPAARIKTARLPREVAERCRRLAAGVSLPVAGIDLRLTPSGEWYCFEVNPSPGFTYYQDATGQPIAEAIAQFLACSEGVTA